LYGSCEPIRINMRYLREFWRSSQASIDQNICAYVSPMWPNREDKDMS